MVASILLVTSLMTFAAAIILFWRRRSIATGLFLFGTVTTPFLPMVALLFTRDTVVYALLIGSGGPVCASVGLLWYALMTKTASEDAPSR